MVSTEQTYVDNLSLLIELYANPLSDVKSKLLTPEEHRALFGGIQGIHKLNQQLLAELKARQKQWYLTRCLLNRFILTQFS